MPVYSVDLSTTVVVQAVDAVDAFRKAMREQRTICTEGDMTIDVGAEIRSLSELTSMWDGECLPYGGDGNTRLKDLLPNAGPKPPAASCGSA